MKAEQQQVLEDLAHQLRPSLAMAIARLNKILRDEQPNLSLKKQVLAIRSLCRKANRVAHSAGLISFFASGESAIELRQTGVNAKRLLEMIMECAQDNEILLSPHRRIKITIDDNSFAKLDQFFADPVYVEQAINCLLDNAGKYSFSDTAIEITARREKGKVLITVTNRGIVLSSEDVAKCGERGWRGEQAKLVTGEGSGLGLWFVREIMKAHKGLLLVSPSDSAGQTRVSLVFPSSKETT